MQTSDWVDGDGYPTEAALERVQHWPADDLPGLFEFLREIWWAADLGFSSNFGEDEAGRTTTKHSLSTFGWSGNESIIHALEQNSMVWSLTWYSERRGGHYLFLVPKGDDDAHQ